MYAAKVLTRIATLALLSCLCVAPWLNGGADAFLRWHLFVGVALAWVCLLLSIVVGESARPNLPSVSIVLFAAVCLCIWHLSPLHHLDTPMTRAVELRAELTSYPPGGDGQSFEHTLDPTNGRTQLASLLMAIAVFLAAYELFADRRRLRWAYLLLGVNAAAVTIFALIQRYDGSSRLYGVFELPVNQTAFGPFVYHNMAGVFLAMSLPAALYFLPSPPVQGISSSGRPRLPGLRAAISDLSGRDLLALMTVIAIIVGLLLSLSRGAIVVSCVAAAIMWIATLRRSSGKRNLVTSAMVITIAVAAMIVFVGSDRLVTNRIASLGDETLIVNETRLPVWRDSLTLIADFPLLGGGLGSYGLLNSGYRTFDDPFWWSHAHNQYLETFVDTGILGLALMLMSIGFVLAISVVALRRIDTQGRSLVAVSVFAVIVGVLHGAIDYCLVVPSTFFLFATCSGILFALAESRASRWLVMPVNRLSKIVAYTVVLGGVIWSAHDSWAEAKVDVALKRVPWQEAKSSLTLDRLDSWISEIEQATATREHVLAHEALTELYFTRYRVESAGILADELSLPRDDPNLWDWTLPVVLHHRVHTLHRDGNASGIDEIRNQPAVRDNLLPAMEHAIAGLRVSPLLPSLFTHLEEVEFLLDQPTYDGTLLRRAVRFAGNDAELLFASGRLHFSAGRYDEAYQVWRQCLSESEALGPNVIRLASQHLSVEELIRKVLPESPELLVSLAESTFEQVDDRQIVLATARKQLQNEAVENAKSHFLLAQIHKLSAEPDLAIAEYRRAIAMEPKNGHWRREFVRLLLDQNRINEAEREAWLCTQIEPNVPRNMSLLSQTRQRQLRRNP